MFCSNAILETTISLHTALPSGKLIAVISSATPYCRQQLACIQLTLNNNYMHPFTDEKPKTKGYFGSCNLREPIGTKNPSGRFWSVLVGSGRFWSILVGSGRNPNYGVPKTSGRFWSVLVGSGRFWSVLVVIGACLGPPCNPSLHRHFS